MKQELQEKSERLEEIGKENEDQRTQIDHLKETLEKSSLSLPKKQKTLKRKRNNVQQEGEKRLKLQQSIEKEESQKLIAKIEIPAKHNN